MGRGEQPGSPAVWAADSRGVWRFARTATGGTAILPALFTALSLLSLLFNSLVRPSALFGRIVAAYDQIVGTLFFLVDLVVRRIPFFAGIDFGWWHHTTFILLIYFSLDVRIGYLRRPTGRSPAATIVSTVLIGLVCAVAAGLASGRFAALGDEDAAAFAPILGYAAYELLKAPFTAAWLPAPGLTAFQSYLYYSSAYGILGVLLGVASIALAALALGDRPGASFIALAMFMVFLAARNLALGFVRTFYLHPDRANWRHHFLRTGSFPVAIALLRALFLLLLLILANAGANAIQA